MGLIGLGLTDFWGRNHHDGTDLVPQVLRVVNGVDVVDMVNGVAAWPQGF
jgi:hypothetical protein